MNELMQELEAAYAALSSIPVTGDAVDAMSLARLKLRKVYSELKKLDSNNNLEHTD